MINNVYLYLNSNFSSCDKLISELVGIDIFNCNQMRWTTHKAVTSKKWMRNTGRARHQCAISLGSLTNIFPLDSVHLPDLAGLLTPTSDSVHLPDLASLLTPTSDPVHLPELASLLTPTSDPVHLPELASLLTPTSDPVHLPELASLLTPTSDPVHLPDLASLLTPTSDSKVVNHKSISGW